MNPKQFLIVGGAVLLVVGILGYVGVIGPTAQQSLFGSNWWFDNQENLAHAVLGVAGLVSAFVLPAPLRKLLVAVLGILGVVVGVYSLVISPTLLGANLENPADTILHLVVGAWALYAALASREA